MFPFIIALHVVVSVFLIFVILLQPGKSDGMAAFSGGGGGSQTVFGGRGSVTFLSKVTTGCAIIFMLTSLTLAWRSSHSDSVLRARRNLAATDAAKKTESSGPLSVPLPTGQTAPAPVTGGSAIPAQGSGTPAGNNTPATPAPAATKGPAAPTVPAAPAKK
jgi:preprotein translocase subunit SecG